jgi:ligand-binding sensor domain-containing protein
MIDALQLNMKQITNHLCRSAIKSKIFNGRFVFFFLLHALCGINLYAQNSYYTYFDVNSGFPTNYVYRTIEDKDGFLWVATDAGLGRFDGKYFQWYTTKDGLPDNVVLSIAIEKDGTIWVNCFKQAPAYFDKVKNRFIKAVDDHTLAKISTTLNMYLFSVDGGGVTYLNDKGNFFFKNKKLVPYQNTVYKHFLITSNADGTEFRRGTSVFKDEIKIIQTKGTRIIDSAIVKIPSNHMLFSDISDHKMFLFGKKLKKCYIISNLRSNPIRFKLDSVSIPESFNNYLISRTSFYLIGLSGKTYVFDKNTLKYKVFSKGDYLPNSLYDDSHGNIWVSTIDKGLLVYRNQELRAVAMPKGYKGTNFFSLERKENGAFLAGNYYGEVLETGNGITKVHTITNAVTSRIRKILAVGPDVFTFSEEGTFYNYKNEILNPKTGIVFPSKMAIKFNDSTILVGTHWGLVTLNTKTKKLTERINIRKRITALVKGSDHWAYFGSNDGLYKYDFNTGQAFPLQKINSALEDRITALGFTSDQILWVATSNSGILAFKNEQLLNDGSKKLTKTYTSITSGKPGQIWAATPEGINAIKYQLNGNKLNYSIQNLTVNDGLASNTVQEMVYHDGKLYAANGGGIAIVPESFRSPKFNIITHLIRMNINQKDTILASSYRLKSGQQNIRMQFAGVDLTGHFKRFQYTLDRNGTWIDLAENTLTVQLPSGEHVVQVRSVDANDNISNQVLTLKFTIAIPFWQSIWFWLTIGFVVQLILVYSVNKAVKRSKEIKLGKQINKVQTAALEQQAFTSLMNPHFIFNALNSIQHYINVQDRQNANRYLSDFASLIRKNFEAAQDSFVPLEEEIENIKLYLNLEQMRFNDQFNYKITIERSLEIEEWMIPTMILQPLLENAMLHGIMPSKVSGKLRILFKKQQDDLLIVIIDNGIGLVNSNILKVNSRHKSRGMELIKRRIKALSSFGTQPITINMEPAFKSKNNPGNRISFLIPGTLHQAWLRAKHS